MPALGTKKGRKHNPGQFQKKEHVASVVLAPEVDASLIHVQEPEIEPDFEKSIISSVKKAGRHVGSLSVDWISSSNSTKKRRVNIVMDFLKKNTGPSFEENSDKCWMELADMLSRIQSRFSLKHPNRFSVKKACDEYRDVIRETNDDIEIEKELNEEKSFLQDLSPATRSNLILRNIGNMSRSESRMQRKVQLREGVGKGEGELRWENANKVMQQGGLGLKMKKWKSLHNEDGTLCRHREANVEDAIREMFLHEQLISGLQDQFGEKLEEMPNVLEVRTTTDGAQVSKRHGMITTTFSATLFESMINNPRCNFTLAHSYGEETKANMKKYLKGVFRQLKDINGTTIDVMIGRTKKSLKVSVFGIYDMKFLYNIFGIMNWNSKRGPFSVFCKCRKGDDHSQCTLRTNKETLQQHKKAIKKFKNVEKGKMDMDEYETWVSEKNDGVYHNGALVEWINMDECYADTLHMKMNVSVSILRCLWSFIVSIDEEVDADDNVKFDKRSRKTDIMLQLLEMEGKFNSYLVKDVHDGDRPKMLGEDCESFRKLFVTESSDVIDFGNLIIDGDFENLWKRVKLTRFGSFLNGIQDLCTMKKGTYMHNLLVSIYTFFSINQEVTELYTNEVSLQRLEKMCCIFRKSSGDTLFKGLLSNENETIYAHVVGVLLPLLARRWFLKTGKGYGYMSMQAPEHCNKVSKTLYKTRTNGRWNMENYDAYAMLMHYNRARYLETRIIVTRGQKRFVKKKEENNDDSKSLFIKMNL